MKAATSKNKSDKMVVFQSYFIDLYAILCYYYDCSRLAGLYTLLYTIIYLYQFIYLI